jgi:hypothetical protein
LFVSVSVSDHVHVHVRADVKTFCVRAQQGPQVPCPQHASAPLRTLFDGVWTLPSLAGIGSLRAAGSGAHVPQVPTPQQAIAPLRALWAPVIILPSLGGIGSARPPGRAAIALAVGAAVAAAVGAAVASAVGAAVASAVGAAVASGVAVLPVGFSAGGELAQPINARVSVAEMVFASSIVFPWFQDDRAV